MCPNWNKSSALISKIQCLRAELVEYGMYSFQSILDSSEHFTKQKPTSQHIVLVLLPKDRKSKLQANGSAEKRSGLNKLLWNRLLMKKNKIDVLHGMGFFRKVLMIKRLVTIQRNKSRNKGYIAAVSKTEFFAIHQNR